MWNCGRSPLLACVIPCIIHEPEPGVCCRLCSLFWAAGVWASGEIDEVPEGGEEKVACG